jgi:hypothetical protein
MLGIWIEQTEGAKFCYAQLVDAASTIDAADLGSREQLRWGLDRRQYSGDMNRAT